MTEATPTWGYRPDGSAEIFDLAPGEGLPEGWHASPDVITDPTLATAEALTTAADRSAQARARARTSAWAGAAPASRSSAAPDLAAENERLRADNARLTADVAELRQTLAASETAREEAVAVARVLVEQLEEIRARAAAPERASDGEAAGQPPSEPPGSAPDPAAAPAPPEPEQAAPVQLGQAPRTREEAREAVRALLVEGLPDREIARRVGVSPSTVAAVRKAGA